MKDWLIRFFQIEAKETSIRTEFIAGLTTFLTVMYIVPLNGIIMSKAGMPIEAVITGTAVITIVATLINGFWSNTPITMSVGLGLNSYFAFALVLGEGLPWEQVLGIVFISGILFLVLTVTNIRAMIIDSISSDFKIAISAGIGVFIAFIGLKEMGIIADHPATLVTMGDLSSAPVLLGIAGLFITLALVAWRVKGAFIISIVITAILGYIFGIAQAPESLVSMPASMEPIFLKLDIPGAFTAAMIAPIITFMLTDLFDSLGTLAGVGQRAGIFEEGSSRSVQKALEADAAATVLGSLMGLSTTTSFIESSAGVEEGGRTGLTAVFTALLFILTLFLLPFFKSIHPNAIFPVLVIVGVLMFADLKNIDFAELDTGIPAFLIITMMPLTYSITKGLAAGFIAYTFIKLVTGKFRELNAVVVVMAIVSVIAFIVG